MEFRKAGFIPFTEKQWLDYKARMMKIIPSEALSTSDLLKDPIAAQFVKNYADANFINDKEVEKRRSQGITYKFATMSFSDNEETLLYPIVNEYKLHHIYRTGYFVKEHNEIKMKYIDVVPKDILIS